MLQFEEKVKILFHLMNGLAVDAIAEMFGTNDVEIREIWDNQLEIMEVNHFFVQSSQLPLRGGLYPRMENILFSWLSQQGMVQNKVLGEKARRIIHLLNESPTSKNAPMFVGSNNWANAFRSRFGIPTGRPKSNLLPTMHRDVDEGFSPSTKDPDISSNSFFGESTAEVNEFKLEEVDNPTEVVDLECEDDQNVSERTFKEETSFAQCQGLEIVSGDVGTQLSELTESSLTEDNATVQGEVQGDETSAVDTGDDYKIETEDYQISEPVFQEFNSTETEEGDEESGDVDVQVNEEIKQEITNDVSDTATTSSNVSEATSTFNGKRSINDELKEDPETGDNEEPTTRLRPKKRKRPTLITDDRYSSDDSSDSTQKKRSRPGKVLVPTRGGVKSMNLVDYKEDKVIKIFKPVLKYAKDSCWPEEDCIALNNLYRKSLKSCGGNATQATITQFFKKKK